MPPQVPDTTLTPEASTVLDRCLPDATVASALPTCFQALQAPLCAPRRLHGTPQSPLGAPDVPTCPRHVCVRSCVSQDTLSNPGNFSCPRHFHRPKTPSCPRPTSRVSLCPKPLKESLSLFAAGEPPLPRLHVLRRSPSTPRTSMAAPEYILLSCAEIHFLLSIFSFLSPRIQHEGLFSPFCSS